MNAPSLTQQTPSTTPAERPRTRITPLARLEPGTRLKITQYIRHGNKDEYWAHEVVGTLLTQNVQDTGSWFASTPTHRVQLHRLLIQKEDGEKTLLSMDARTRITILNLPQAT